MMLASIGHSSHLHRAVFVASLLLLPSLCLDAAEPGYPRDVGKWREVSPPLVPQEDARAAWFLAANSSSHEWRVFADGNLICARVAKRTEDREKRPNFRPRAGHLRVASAFAMVDDGWLVGFNHGEFGKALYWFSSDGTHSYKVSDDQVVDFFSLADGLHAIEGLAHMSVSRGSVIRIERARPGAHWQASTVVKLPCAPYAVSVRRDGTALITLSDSLVCLREKHRIETLLQDAPWGNLYPNSSILSPDEKRLYIGMRQFVGEVDLTGRRLRLLIPSNEFLNKGMKETPPITGGSTEFWITEASLAPKG